MLLCLVHQLFKGTMYHCKGLDVSGVVTKIDCINKGLGYYWVNEKYNFDNLGQVICSLPTGYLYYLSSVSVMSVMA